MTDHPGSFRDPGARVHILDERIFRVIKPVAQPAYRSLTATAFYRKAVEDGQLIESREVVDPGLAGIEPSDLVLEHPALSLISYPYEWPFALLQTAAVHHLDLQIDALDAGFVLTDANAYNIQFRFGRPLFIDVTSFRPYQEREPWTAHHQFCEAFLAPLVLQARLGIPYQAWYRGSLDGIPADAVARMLRWHDRLSPVLLSHLVLPAALSRKDKKTLRQSAEKKSERGIPKSHYSAVLKELRHFISNLAPKASEKSIWARYSKDNTYLPEETQSKIDVVASFCRQLTPDTLLDIGCNDGVFSMCALREGAALAVGLDSDQGALHRAAMHACGERLAFIPLCVDIANPSPNQGFAGSERSALSTRLGLMDAVLALAVIHHLVIGRNIPLGRAIAWIVERGRSGLIEFIPKTDPTIQEMLTLREDIFPAYTRDAFVAVLKESAEIVQSTQVSQTGRELFHFRAL